MVREVKNKNYFKQVTETLTEETFESTDETSTNTSNDLSAQIKREITTRFRSDLNSSFYASGEGTIGVVDVEGGASLLQ